MADGGPGVKCGCNPPWLCFFYTPDKFIDLAKPTGSNFDLVEGLD